jgi:hypothetical protein
VSRPRRSWLYSTANLVHGANYTIMDSRCYGCHSHYDGNSCSNAIRVRKDHIEDVLLRGPETGLAALLSPERVERMAKEMRNTSDRAARSPRRSLRIGLPRVGNDPGRSATDGRRRRACRESGPHDTWPSGFGFD